MAVRYNEEKPGPGDYAPATEQEQEQAEAHLRQRIGLMDITASEKGKRFADVIDPLEGFDPSGSHDTWRCE